LLRAAQMGPLRIMLPMVTNLEEIHQAKSIIREEQVALGVGPVPVGIMIEVPAAAVMADRLANEVDFFSIGTNDLTQYVLAMDRNHPSLARQVDGLHPAVLALIEMTTKAAQAAGIEVGVCGGIAGDLAGVPLLVGLGVEELSVSLPSVPGVKARVRELELVACRKLAQRALTLSSADDVRALVNEEMPEWSTGEGKRS
ncbi:MAG: phosphoenolpyruvate--protein phosphotransferase, partial [Bdellovibrionales bacterium]|nr:phosphoenolpyruvate--protein phosphotransferase [Bdellovibrionales bacterium]